MAPIDPIEALDSTESGHALLMLEWLRAELARANVEESNGRGEEYQDKVLLTLVPCVQINDLVAMPFRQLLLAIYRNLIKFVDRLTLYWVFIVGDEIDVWIFGVDILIMNLEAINRLSFRLIEI